MAKKEITLVRARVLQDCQYGKCNDIVEIDPSTLNDLVGTLDGSEAAVAYAESLSA